MRMRRIGPQSNNSAENADWKADATKNFTASFDAAGDACNTAPGTHVLTTKQINNPNDRNRPCSVACSHEASLRKRVNLYSTTFRDTTDVRGHARSCTVH